MAPSDVKLFELNPWWQDAGAIALDRHIAQFQASPFQWDPPAFLDIPLRPGDLSTLRGPRQVGKTTTLKRMIRGLLGKGERRVLYYSFDTEQSNDAIPDVIRRAKGISGLPPGPWYFFLDEVTSIRDWQRGVKYAWDAGILRDDFVLCTGSSAHRMGTEQLPGRRGKGRNYLQLTVSFRDFCRLAAGVELPEESLTVDDCFKKNGRELLQRLYRQVEALTAAFAVYARVGGFPAAVADHMSQGAVSQETIATLWALIVHEIQQSGLDSRAALKLIERTGISLGSTLSWHSAAQAMDVGSHNTAQAYARALSESFILMTVYYWDMSGGFEPRKQRKLYLMDPLIGHLPSRLELGSRSPNEDGIVECLMAVGLFRSASDQITQSEGTLSALGYWRSRDGREIDFVVPASAAQEGVRRIPIEVKGDAASELKGAASSIVRTFGRGIIATRSTFDVTGEVLQIPVAVLLAALDERAERRLSVL